MPFAYLAVVAHFAAREDGAPSSTWGFLALTGALVFASRGPTAPPCLSADRHPLDMLADGYHARIQDQPPGVQRSILIALYAAGLEQQLASGAFDAGRAFDRLLDHFRAEEGTHGPALAMWRAMTAAMESLDVTAPVASSGRMVPRG